jgi:hypothetical protein
MPNIDHSSEAFENSVKTILTTFGVFTGFAIKSAIDGISFPASPSWFAFWETLCDSRLFVCIATVALLLRFIIGSAVHLNLCYVTEPRSRKPGMLFKDLAFLVVFGLAAVYMIKAGDVPTFAKRASLFVLVGAFWSVLDLLLRFQETEPGEQTLFSPYWLGIDFLQLGLIWFVLCGVDGPWLQSLLLAVGFAVALYGDMKIVLGASKPAVPVPLGPPAKPAAPQTPAALP